MKLEYVYSESTARPQEIEVCKTTVYFRKDITTEERVFENSIPVTYYVYQEAKMPIDEFKKMADNQASINAVRSSDNKDNQLIIMEAIADLYDAIAMLAGGMSK